LRNLAPIAGENGLRDEKFIIVFHGRPARRFPPSLRRMPPQATDDMKLHSDNTQQYQTVTGYDASGVEINAERFNYSLLVMPETPPRPWNVTRFEDLTGEHFEQIALDEPDVVILGTGERQRFVHPRLIASLSARHTGVESMDSQAACRTYNVLMGEGRKVTLALIIDPA